jgi:hypothetical protein
VTILHSAHQASHTATISQHNDDHQAAARAQAARKRLAEAALRTIAHALNGTGLTIQTLDSHALITKPGHRRNTIHVTYAGGAVHHNGVYLGILDGYEPADGQRIRRDQILAALNGHTPPQLMT